MVRSRYGVAMAPSLRALLPVLAGLSEDRSRDVPLQDVAGRVALSPHHAQRTFRRLVGESPKQYQLRLRLESAAVRLATSEDRVIDIAGEVGFADHETFTRAFGRHFGRSPSAYRRSAAPAPPCPSTVRTVGPCVGLYRTSLNEPPAPAPSSASSTASSKESDINMAYDIEVSTLEATPILFTSRRIEHADVAAQLAEMLPDVFSYVMAAGLPMTGPPLVRHAEASPAFLTLDAAIPMAAPAEAPADRPHIQAGTLPAGDAAVTIHTGPYDTLSEAHIALDKWCAANQRSLGGAPWEVYLTDPGEVPDPNDWQTQVVWPLA